MQVKTSFVRFKRKNGDYSCQLIFSRTKIVHDITVPRAELVAAVLNCSVGHNSSRSYTFVGRYVICSEGLLFPKSSSRGSKALCGPKEVYK